MFILDLPLFVVSQIFSDWLETGDLGRLDAAICNRSVRQNFLSTLSEPFVRVIGYPSKDTEDSYLLWLFNRRLHVQSLSISDPDLNLTNEQCTIFRKLDFLDIYYRNRLRIIGDACANNLKFLILRGCEATIESALQMVSQFKQLHTFEIAELTKFMDRKKIKATHIHTTSNRIMQCNKSLRAFVCNWTNFSLIHLQEILTSCSNITRLELNITGLDDSSLYIIATCCSNLQILKLIRSTCTTIEGISSLSVLSNLKCLELNSTAGVTNDSLIPIISNNPYLTTISLRYMNHITSLSIMKIAATCPGLISLDFSYSPFIKDDAILLLANKCPQLQELKLCGCNFITDASMMRLANMCTKLTSINIKECSNITKLTSQAFGFMGVKPYKKKLR